jgi:TonB family protein
VLENINYPAELVNSAVHGEIVVEIILNNNGTVVKARIIKGLHPCLDNEIIRVVKNSPKWIVYKTNNEPVRVSIIIPPHE